jgi:phage tail tube protein FII
VQKYQLKINNAEIYNIDLYNNTRVVNGRDQMAALRAAIGE